MQHRLRVRSPTVPRFPGGLADANNPVWHCVLSTHYHDAVTESAFATAAVWSYGLAAAAYVVFAFRLALGWRHSTRALLLMAATLTTVLWAVSGAAVARWPLSAAWPAAIAFDSLRYGIWFVFLGMLLGGARRADDPVKRALPVPRWIVVIAAAALVASLFLTGGEPFAITLDIERRTATFGVHLALAIAGLILIEQLIRRAHPQARWAIKPLCVGLGGVFAFDLFFYADAMLFGVLDKDIWVARAIANALIIPFLAVATARNTGWTIEMHVSRRAVFHSTALLVSGVFLLVVASAGYFVRYFGGDWGHALQIELSFAALLAVVLMVSSGSFRAKLKVFVSKHFFSFRYDYREEWLRFTRTLSTENAPQGLQESAIQALADLVESPGGVLWLREEDEAFHPAARWNMGAVDAVEPDEGPLATFLERTAWVIDLGEHASEPSSYAGLTLPAWMPAIPSAWLVVPLLSGADLIGFVILATPRAAIELNWELRDLLKTASRQAASYLGHVRAAEALLEARKFDAFNRMSAFVVHDLKNLVAQLSLMLRNAERHRDNPDFQRDMLSTVQNVVEHMNKLLLQLRAGTTPVDSPSLVDLESVVRKVAGTKSGGGAAIRLDLAPAVCTLGHEDRLKHVIGHLVQNAQDATADRGEVSVRLFRDGNMAVVEIVDTGVGMSPEFIRDRLFKPFETTKAAGMGIGVYESSHYVTALGGQIKVDSTPNVGTQVRILLPLANAASAPAGSMREVA
jgi:putative PEP-CTERM system histidine kinase